MCNRPAMQPIDLYISLGKFYAALCIGDSWMDDLYNKQVASILVGEMLLPHRQMHSINFCKCQATDPQISAWWQTEPMIVLSKTRCICLLWLHKMLAEKHKSPSRVRWRGNYAWSVPGMRSLRLKIKINDRMVDAASFCKMLWTFDGW